LASRVVFAGGAEAAANIEVISDIRHREARAFNKRAAHLDAPISPLRDGDITKLWQNYYSVAWKDDKPRALAGLTERPALFMLEQLGRDYGMRVFFQAEHESQGAGGWAHRILRSSNLNLKGQLDAAGSAWPAVLADQLLISPQDVASPEIGPTGAAMAAHIGEPEKLYSWIIAPRSVAQHI
jgi:hypothetical protein